MSDFLFMSYLLPFLGAIMGMGIVYALRPKEFIAFKLVLAFSGAFLLGITIFHLLPEVFSQSQIQPGLWIVGGLLLQMVLEYLSQGAEHGHAHINEAGPLPWLLLLSLGLHAFIEGFPLIQQKELLWGIFIHKIPIGMVLFYLVWNTKASKGLKISALFLFTVMSPLGSWVNEVVGFNQTFQIQITALVMGMLLHIATTILFESNQGHAFNLRKLLSILLAFGISYIL